MKYKIFKSSDDNVSKFVFEKKDIAVETVLYKYPTYEERTVICCSVQCGCPVGCKFCGTGKFFVRNLTSEEIIEQVKTAVEYTECNPENINKFQIMFMSMGEPFLNYTELVKAIKLLAFMYPNAQLLISTSAPKAMYQHISNFAALSIDIPQIGLQFSVHESNDKARKELIPTQTCTLRQISALGEFWASFTGRKPFFNYCVHENNSNFDDVINLYKNFNPNVWECTLSVICEKDDNIKSSSEKQKDRINSFSYLLQEFGYSTRIFDPAGQDDIGGGCGQLWYFQEWLKGKR